MTHYIFSKIRYKEVVITESFCVLKFQSSHFLLLWLEKRNLKYQIKFSGAQIVEKIITRVDISLSKNLVCNQVGVIMPLNE